MHSEQSHPSEAILPVNLADAYTAAGDVRLHYKVGGEGPPVILLHGFPDFWYGWRRQLGPLVDAQYRVIVPDLRGYNLSDKPAGVRAYALDALAADVLRLADSVCPGERVALVGHDWGAAVAWWIGIHQPERLTHLVIVNVPHPVVFAARLRHRSQLLKSWYILFFQLPRLPELLLRSGGYFGLRRALQASSRPGAFTAYDLALYRSAWEQPGALTAMLNWYRAVARHRPTPRRESLVTVPTLILWGAQDVALEREMAEASHRFCLDGRLIVYEEASHWPHLEVWDEINPVLRRFLYGGTAAVNGTVV